MLSLRSYKLFVWIITKIMISCISKQFFLLHIDGTLHRIIDLSIKVFIKYLCENKHDPVRFLKNCIYFENVYKLRALY